MRVKYISPTSLGLFYKNETLYYLRYLAKKRLPREPQTEAMSVGSAFDAFVKAYLYKNLHGGGGDAQYSLQALFESQVAEPLRDWAWNAGHYVFKEYQRSGALADIMLGMLGSEEEPRFEFDVGGEVGGVPFFGKPDLSFRNKQGARVIYDWKVNGFCSKNGAAPKKGYVSLGYSSEWDYRRGERGRCNNTVDMAGVLINPTPFEETNESWATQLSIYSWCLGIPVGEPTIIGIDQIACKGGGEVGQGLRFASHRAIVSRGFQEQTLSTAQHMWSVINSDWFFRGLTREESQRRCKVLDTYVLGVEACDDFGFGKERVW